MLKNKRFNILTDLIGLTIPKHILILNFDYFRSFDKFEQKSCYDLDLNLDHTILKLCLDLLSNNKDLASHINLDNFLGLLTTSCTLLCRNDDFYKSVIRCIIDIFDQDYLKYNPHAEYFMTFCHLQESGIYPGIKNVIMNRLSYIDRPSKIVNKITNTEWIYRKNTISFFVDPQCNWLNEADCNNFKTLVYSDPIHIIGRHDETSHMELCDLHIRLDRHKKRPVSNTIQFDISVPDPKKRNIQVAFQRITCDYPENNLLPEITNYDEHSFIDIGFGYIRAPVVLNIALSPYDMYYVCVTII